MADNISNKDNQSKPILVRGVDPAIWRKVRSVVLDQGGTLGQFVTAALAAKLKKSAKRGLVA